MGTFFQHPEYRWYRSFLCLIPSEYPSLYDRRLPFLNTMRVLAISTAILLLLMALLPLGTLSEGGIDPRVPDDLYGKDEKHPVVEFDNKTVEEGDVGPLGDLNIYLYNFEIDSSPGIINEFEISLEIYRWGEYGRERDLDELDGPLPMFRYFDEGVNDTVESLTWETLAVWDATIDMPPLPQVAAPVDAVHGYYRIRVTLDLVPVDENATSMGHFTEQEWSDNIEAVRNDEEPTDTTYLVSEAGFTVVPEHYETISQPNLVPDFGDFTTPVIRPGDTGIYNFTVTNRYDLTITDVFVTVEFYMWATIDDAKPIEDLDGPVPVIKGIGEPLDKVPLGSIDPGSSMPVRLEIATEEDTPKGTYFVRHRIEFEYDEVPFDMESRGFFTWDQWEGFDYTNLYYQLGTAGIVPDSSFSVKDPVPLWPLATLIVLCILLGSLAVVFYLAEEHGGQYPRLKKGLQYWSGKYQQRKRLLQQRLEDIRADQEVADEPLDDDDAGE